MSAGCRTVALAINTMINIARSTLDRSEEFSALGSAKLEAFASPPIG